MNSRTREDVETTILALLVCRRGGCSLTQLCRDYYDLECEQIPWKALGYTTLLSFFQSMSKTVQIENRNNIIFVKGVASNKSKHVSILIDGQKQQKSLVGRKSYRPSHYYPKTGPPRIRISAKILSTIIDLVNMHPDGVNKDFILQRIQMDMPFANITMSDIEDQLHELSHKVYLSNNKIFPVQSKSQISHLKSSKVTAGGEEDSDNMSDYADEDDFQFIPHGDTSHASDAKSFMKTKSTSSFIQETVFKWQDQTTEDKPDKYTREKETNTNNSHNLYNDNCNDNIQIHTNCNSNIENENYLDGTHAEDLISDKVRFRLEKLIQNNPDGIWCADLPEKYLEEYKVSLNYTELGFNSVREFASQLTEIFHCVQLENTGDFVLYSAKSGIPSSNSKEKQKTVNLAELHQIYERDEEAEALPTTLSLDTCKKLIPDGIVTIGESVGQLNVADLVTDEKPYIEVVVVEVFTPSFFWVQLRKKQKSFKTFMDDLHTFYTTKHQDYVIPPVVLEKGLNCACMYNNIWHRGIIKTVKPDLQVTVMFYDYGTLKTYPPDAVYYLHRVFSSIPAQAIPCGLINTRPYKGLKWTRNATHQFAVRTSSTPLIATVASVDIEDNSIMVTLTDTLEEEDVHINDWLVEQKLAEHGKMVCMKTRNFPFRYYLECQSRVKQKCKIYNPCKAVKPVECTKSICTTDYSQNKEALYNNFHAIRDHQVSSVSCQKISKEPEYPKDSSSFEETNYALNIDKQTSRKLMSLYEKLMNLKRNRSSCDENHEEFNDNGKTTGSSSSDLLSRIKFKQKVNEKYIGTIELNNNLNESSVSSESQKEKKISLLSTEKEGILKKYVNIPKAYANHFHIQDPENAETYTDVCNKEHESKHMDWSIIRKNVAQKNKYISQQSIPEKIYESVTERRDNILLAESRFLAVVQSSVYFAIHDEDIRWSPAGNVNEMDDSSPLVLRNIQKRAASSTNAKTLAIPKKILNILMKKNLSTESSDKINEVQSVSTIQESNSLMGNDSHISNDDNTFCNKNSLTSSDKSTSQFENHYLRMKAQIPKHRLMQILSMMQQVSSYSLDLDSDDLSSLDTLTSSHKGTSYNNDTSQMKEYECISSKVCSKVMADNSSHDHIETESIGMSESSKSGSNRYEPYEEIMPTVRSVPSEPSKSVTDRNESNEELASTVSSVPSVSSKSVSDRYESNEEVAPTVSSVPSESSKSVTDTYESNEELAPTESLVSQTSLVANELIPIQSVVTQESTLIREPISMKKSVLTDEVPFLQNSMLQVQQLVEKAEQIKNSKKEEVSIELVPVSETLPPDVITETCNVPVFNDIDIESDEAEWDVNVSFTDVHNFIQIDSPYNKNIQNTLGPELDTNLTIEEVNDSDLTKNSNWVNNRSDRCINNVSKDLHSETSFISSIDHSSDEFENLKNEDSKSITIRASATCFETNAKAGNKNDSILTNILLLTRKSPGRSKTLLEMLNKIKARGELEG